MLRVSLILATGAFFFADFAYAETEGTSPLPISAKSCFLDTTGFDPSAGKTPVSILLPTQMADLSADAPVSTTTPFFTVTSPVSGSRISYIECEPGHPFGRSFVGIADRTSHGSNIYSTDIPGVGIKFSWSNGRSGGALSGIPSSGVMPGQPGGPLGRLILDANAYFQIDLYKISENVRLTDKTGDQVIPRGDSAYFYVGLASIADYAQKLIIGDFKIISTPSCEIDGKKIIDFGSVTSSLLTGTGIERDLNFKITCKTAYGNYAATASITASSVSDDAKYILVEDAGKNTDRLGIKITNSAKNDLLVNGSNSESKTGIISAQSAEFNWKATLFHVPGKAYPTNGAFSATAEIILQIE